MRNIILVSGGFDPIHQGHIKLIKEAAKYGSVVVLLNSDEWLKQFLEALRFETNTAPKPINNSPIKRVFNGKETRRMTCINGPVSYTHLTLPTIYSV